MSGRINSITVGELFLIMAGCVAIYMFVKNLIVPIVSKWLKIEDNSKKIKGLPELIATQQRQIDDINARLEKGNVKFDMIEKEISNMQTEMSSSNALLRSMDMKLEILVGAQMGANQSKEDIELLNKAYKDKKLEQLKK